MTFFIEPSVSVTSITSLIAPSNCGILMIRFNASGLCLLSANLARKSLKIEIAAKKLPACFTVFDIVYCDNKEIIDLPLMERKKLLFDTVSETPRMALSRHIESNGVDFFNLAKRQGLEGIVAKRRDSKYYFGKRTKDWVKMKALLDDDFVVCGYFFKGGK